MVRIGGMYATQPVANKMLTSEGYNHVITNKAKVEGATMLTIDRMHCVQGLVEVCGGGWALLPWVLKC